jgi:hypothetical protein
MGVKRGTGKVGAGKTVEEARAGREKSLKAKRHARIILGTPPPSQTLTPKRMKPVKHKKPAGEEEE